MKLKLPDNEQEQIEFIHDAVLDHFKGSSALAREWFEADNYYLKGEAPVKSIRSGNINEVFKAVKKLIEEDSGE